MKISISIPEEFTVTNHGYGVISQQIVLALQRLGWSVPYRDPSAQVELCIGQPYLWQWSSRNSYKIGFAEWESTKIPDRWKSPLKTCDELWTASPAIAQVFEDEGFPVAQVYQHGIDGSMWKPRLRTGQDRIKFLHIGEPAPRKGGQLAYNTFKKLYGNDERVSLTIKAFGTNTIRGERIGHPHKELNNVKLIRPEVSEEEMVRIIRSHDVLVYPSYGEGFGLIPLQAMATGMPVICTEAWAPYGDLILPDLRLGSTLGPSPWRFHTGNMWHPHKKDLESAMTKVVDNFDYYAQSSYNLHKFVTKRYNWDKLTEKAFRHIKERFES